MKINNLPEKPAGAINGAGKPAERTPSPTASRAGATAGGDAGVTVSLSNTTQSMAANVAKASTDVFNAQKVEAVKTAIANGTFTINAEAVADKLLTNAREMLGVVSK